MPTRPLTVGAYAHTETATEKYRASPKAAFLGTRFGADSGPILSARNTRRTDQSLLFKKSLHTIA